jgi:WD40 repeat protein
LQFRAFSSDGKSVLLTSKTTAMLVEVATGRPLAQWKPGASPPAGVTFFDQAGSKVPSEALEKGRAAEVAAKLTRHGLWRRNLALSLDGRRLLATAAEADDPRTGESIDVDPNLVVVDVGSGKTILRVPTQGICSSFLPDSRRLIIAEAGVATAWDLDSSKVLWHVPLVASAGYPGAPECLRLVPSPVGKVAYLDGVLIDVDTGATLKTLPIGVVPTRVVFSPDGGRIFVAGAAEGGSKSRRTSPSIWDVASGAELTKLGATNDLGWLDSAVAWSPDGRSVLLLNGRGPMIFDAVSGRRIPAFAGHERWWSLDEEVEAWLLGRRLGREIPALREVDF